MAAAQAPGTDMLVRAEQTGERALEVLHPTSFPRGPEAVQAADRLLSGLGQWLAEHRLLLEDVTPWHTKATNDALADAAASLPEPGGHGGPAKHWRAMSEAHQHLLLLHGELTDNGTARPLHPALRRRWRAAGTAVAWLRRASQAWWRRGRARLRSLLRGSRAHRASDLSRRFVVGSV
ncbi:hypothetical protein [Streptomyces werraensis]|uniref:hypothetical protein n=1 Tax=Streptomyces werraensis TaxID=68284 RepID=UPI0037F1815E